MVGFSEPKIPAKILIGMKRKITLWLASYLVASVLLLFYFHAPLVPLLIAGLATFLITLRRP